MNYPGNKSGRTIKEDSMKIIPTPKLYYSIKEVGELFDEEQHILRYWEREFDLLRPQKNRAGNRVYTEKDIRVLRVIKKLIRKDRLTVTSAKEILANGIPDDYTTVADTPIEKEFAHIYQSSVAQKHPPRPHQLANSSQAEVTTQDVSGTITMNVSDIKQLIELLKDIAGVIEKL